MVLTPKQQRFVDEYLVDLNATQAYLRAGYKVSETVANVNASRLMANAKVQAAIEKRKQDRAQRVEVTQDYVIKTIKDTIERCSSEECFDPKAVLRGAELLGKHLGIFVERREVTGKDGKDLIPETKGVLVVPDVKTPEEWEQMIAAQRGDAE